VAKGGNLLLNIAPSGDGEWDKGAYKLLEQIGDWMHINDEAIYETHSMAPYKFDNVCVTAKNDGSVYLIYLVKEGQTELPDTLILPEYTPKSGANVEILGLGKNLKWSKQGGSMKIILPRELKGKLLKTIAFTIKII
ncbi:MAG: alpha-L-fucosidase, partial [Leeuwenhoekiella sp.]